MECRQRTPSVIARLMGLDTLPPQQPVHKQQRALSENYLRRTAYIGVREKRSSSPEGSSFRMKIDEQQDFKDIFEVPETAIMDKPCNLSANKGKANMSSTEAEEIQFIRRHINAKCLSFDEKFQWSDKQHDAFMAEDSNRDFALNYLGQPDSVLAKHIQDLPGFVSDPQVSRITVIESLNAPKYRDSETYRTLKRASKQGNVRKSPQKLENGSVTYFNEEVEVNYSVKLPKLKLEPNNKMCSSASRIIVLKPNILKAQKAARSISPNSCEDSVSWKHKNTSSPENRKSFVEVGKKDLMSNMEPSRHSYRISSEIPKGRHMRHTISSSVEEVSRSQLRGNESSAAEVVVSSYPNYSDWKNRYQTSFSHSNGSLFSQVAKKHISDRWRTTKRFQEVGLARTKSTLGEMLAVPDVEPRPKHLDRKLSGKQGLHNCLVPSFGDANSFSPLGISSRDGWKDGCAQGSKSRPVSPTAIGSPESRNRFEALQNEKYRAINAVNRGKNQSRMEDFDQKTGFKTGDLRSNFGSCSHLNLENDKNMEESAKEPEDKINENNLSKENLVVPRSSSNIGSNCCLESGNSHPEQGTWEIQDELKDRFEKDFPEQNSVVTSSNGGFSSASKIIDSVADEKTKDVGMSLGIHIKQQSKATACVKDENYSSHDLHTSNQQETITEFPEENLVPLQSPILEPKSPVSSEDDSQPSPVSVLESPSKQETLSDIEGFEIVSADTHGLQKQLQLLKESLEGYSEGSEMNVSSDEDNGEESMSLVEQKRELMLSSIRESRDFSYLVDVLGEAGVYGEDSETHFKTRDTSECPINPVVFETLEKKYGQQIHWEKLERRLLFDQINSGLMEIFQSSINIPEWTKPVTKRLSCRWSWEVIEEELWTSLVSQEKEASKKSSEHIVGKDTKWLELGDDVNAIGREIERLLVEELAVEFVNIYSF